MDFLWSPWRYQYVTGASGASPADPARCIFCDHPKDPDDEKHLILYRGSFCFVLLNLYPYTAGHLMIVPYAHVPDLASTDAAALEEMIRLAQTAEGALRAAYHPDGLNAGFNIGQCAGAGIAGHVHMHVLPRWFADTNFMTVIGETRVLPEELGTTYWKLKKYFGK